MSGVEALILFAYGSLVLELTAFPIPSEASTMQLLGSNDGGDGALASTRKWSIPRKLTVLFLPTAIGVALFLLPVLTIVWPGDYSGIFSITLPGLLWPGVTLVIFGRVLTLSSVLQLRAAKQRGSIPSGLFRHSRNPGLVGMYAFYLGLCLIFGGPWLWLGIPLYFGNMHYRVRLEESHLANMHGADWWAYVDRVARYLPLPGLR